MKIYSSSKTRQKIISLTFDDGPLEEYTPQMLNILDGHQIKATFFVIGKNVEVNSELLQEIHQRGHLIGNHSYSHSPFFGFFLSEQVVRELTLTNEIVHSVINKTPLLFRPPHGVMNPHIKAAVKNIGLIPVGWRTRSLDTVISNPDKLLNKLMRSLKPGAVILFHDTSKSTLNILSEFISYAKKKDYQFERVDKLLSLQPYA